MLGCQRSLSGKRDEQIEFCSYAERGVVLWERRGNGGMDRKAYETPSSTWDGQCQKPGPPEKWQKVGLLSCCIKG